VLKPGKGFSLKDRTQGRSIRHRSTSHRLAAGQLIFEDTPLAEAVAEFNRYSAFRIRLDSEQVGAIRVGGTFRIGDAASLRTPWRIHTG